MTKKKTTGEPTFTVEELAGAERFKQYGYILRAVLNNSKQYTVEQARKALAPFIPTKG